MFSKLFKRNEAVTSIMNAMAKDLERLDSYEWGKLFKEVREHASYSERKWMDIQRSKLEEQWLVTRIAVADLTNGESENDGLIPTTQQSLYQQAHMQAQAVAQHGYSGYQNLLGGLHGNP